jgi:hypothetical protein
MKLVAFLELETSEQLSRKDQADRVADFLDLEEVALDFDFAR